MSLVAEARKKILVVGVGKGLFDRIDPLLNRAYFLVERVPRGQSGLMLSGHVGFDLILVGHPLSDIELAAFVATLRQPGSASAGSQVLVLAEAGRLAEAVRLAGPGPLVALPTDEPRRILEEVAARLLGVVPRTASRLMVRMVVHLEEGNRLHMYQSENISRGGLLIRTDQSYPIGTRMTFDCTLPGDRAPLQGVAEVVRHTVQDVEKLHGVGLRWLELKGDSQKRLFAYLDSQDQFQRAHSSS